MCYFHAEVVKRTVACANQSPMRDQIKACKLKSVNLGEKSLDISGAGNALLVHAETLADRKQRHLQEQKV